MAGEDEILRALQGIERLLRRQTPELHEQPLQANRDLLGPIGGGGGGILKDVNDNVVGVVLDDVYRLQVESKPVSPGTVQANFRKAGITAADSYYLLIDLNNGSGNYKHSPGAGIVLHLVHATALKSQAGAQWLVTMGVVTAINGTDATIAQFRLGFIGLRDTGITQLVTTVDTLPQLTDLTVSGGTLSKLVTNFSTTTTLVNTATALEDTGGGMRPAEVGDLVLRAQQLSGGGDLLVHYHLWYEVR